MKMLMHICCANCSLYPLQSLRKRGIETSGYWFNPNIHPFTEYRSRLDAVKHLQTLWDLDIDYVDHYGLRDFVRNVVQNEADRCEYCYASRLEATAKTAKKNGFDAFTTSLLVSPYQKFDKILNRGAEMSDKYDIEFFGEDFRQGYREGMKTSRELGLYRQKYCGCIYSEMERYAKGSK
jgi:predicted adenine nucleotide alpha hydrolase (AANH) superfamily ATPase